MIDDDVTAGNGRGQVSTSSGAASDETANTDDLGAGPNRGATLWLVATPIGNLGDLSPRAVEVLTSVGAIACEDTRRTKKLLSHAGISTPKLIVANDHTEFDAIDAVLAQLAGGADVAVVSDAGTPGVSDPGQRLVGAALDSGFVVSAIPGPVAAVVAVTISGLPSDRFVIDGFLPRKGAERTERIGEVANERRTVVLYEAPHRIERTLTELAAACGPDRPVAVCRELTKRFETVVRGTLGTIDIGVPRGEYAIVLGPTVAARTATDDEIFAALEHELASGSSRRDAVGLVAESLDVAKNRVYDLLHRTS